MVQRKGTIRAAQTAATIGLDEVQRTLLRLIEENAGIPSAEVDDESSVDGDLAMDSMSFLALQVAVEDTFGINCTPDEILAANTFAAIATLVHERARQAANRHGTTSPRTRRSPHGKQPTASRKKAKTTRRRR